MFVLSLPPRYFGGHPLQPASAYNGGRGQYMWPATGSDGGSNKAPGGLYTGTDPNVAPGALLAIPAAVSATLTMTTVAGAKIRQALTDYGGCVQGILKSPVLPVIPPTPADLVRPLPR